MFQHNYHGIICLILSALEINGVCLVKDKALEAQYAGFVVQYMLYFHYDNTPMQCSVNSNDCKNYNFQLQM